LLTLTLTATTSPRTFLKILWRFREVLERIHFFPFFPEPLCFSALYILFGADLEPASFFFPERTFTFSVPVANKIQSVGPFPSIPDRLKSPPARSGDRGYGHPSSGIFFSRPGS